MREKMGEYGMYKTMLALVGGVTLLSGAALADGMAKGRASCCDAARPWTGFYLGIGAGVGSVVTEISADGGSFDGVGSEGVLGTVIVGYDRQLTSRIVGGVFADYDFASNVSTDLSFDGGGISADQKNTFAIGARLGVLSSPTTLWFGTVGYTQTEFDLKNIGLGTPDFKGFFVGGGVESQLVGGWNLRAEYRFSQFDSESFEFDSFNLEPSTHSARLALTYKWGREEPAHAHAPMK
jgi:outer membrane immunogenic protein